MGLTIYYSGSISSEKLLGPLIEEVSDICKSLEWKSTILTGGNNDDQLTGICFSPEKSEPVFLTFLPGGRLCSPTNLLCKDIYDEVQFAKELMFTACTKTQYAGPEAHIAIIKLLKYISGKYLTNFVVNDEGKYWETGDEKVLYAEFDKYNLLVNIVDKALNDLHRSPADTPGSLAEKIQQILKGKFKDGTA
ncbi:hypothetical protein BH11BAC3_BH11BAC3_02000 [soil metagenome]